MSLTLRLTLTYLLITLCGLSLLGVGFVLLTDRYLGQQRERELSLQAEIYAGFLAELAATPTDLQSLTASANSVELLPADTTVRVFATNGALLSGDQILGPFPSHPVQVLLTNPLPLPVSQSAQRSYVAQPVPGADSPIGVIELSRSSAADQRTVAALRRLVLQAAVLAAVIMAVVSVGVAQSISRPIVRLAQRADRLAHNPALASAPQALSAPHRSELALLDNRLDHMASQLQGRIVAVEQQQARLSSVLTTISEGVIALDHDGAMMFANPAAHALFAAATTAELAAQVAKLALPPHQATEREIDSAGHTLMLHAKPIAQAGETQAAVSAPALVLVVRDITQLRLLEQARVRFFRTVSHDLRTPLAAIRGTLENLHDAAPPSQRPQFATLEAEAARLTRLVNELLAPPDNGVLLPLEQQPIDLGALAEELTMLLQGRARRVGVALTTCATNTATIVGDRDRIKQAVLNLLDNALRITPPGGTIIVDVAVERDAVVVRVTDDGPGVPDGQHERIWERGVQLADASTPTIGGSGGLGLAIVREIIAAHNGTAAVRNAPHGGAQFVLRFPTASYQDQH